LPEFLFEELPAPQLTNSANKSRMVTLYHYPLCPHSRFAGLILGEYAIAPELVEAKPFERRVEFLHIDPSGLTPLIVTAEMNSRPFARAPRAVQELR
jgi:hypothetical protein